MMMMTTSAGYCTDEGFLSSKALFFQEGEEVENMVATNHTGNADTSVHQVMCR